MKDRGQLRPIEYDDLGMIHQWRNSPEVRRFMYTSHEISWHEHTQWYESIRHDKNRHALIFSLGATPVGYVNIGPVKSGQIADWGFYTAPGAARGTGFLMGCCALKMAFVELGLHKLCGQSLVYNNASRRFHLRLGFEQEGELIDQFFDGACYHNIVCFGLTNKQWQELNRVGSYD